MPENPNQCTESNVVRCTKLVLKFFDKHQAIAKDFFKRLGQAILLATLGGLIACAYYFFK